MAKFRKKPVEIEARQLNFENYDDACSLVRWCGGTAEWDGIAIQTLEGTMLAENGDWIIKGIQGEFYPCKPDIFALTYDAA
ncbi:hypothetical protein [Streptomyces sp. NPDC006638]|uniref:hypothetical protein n=1 Tax=Streptomyces sp. NPDC006638 TaxID=3157183 RepID=UPI0033B94161